MCIIHLVDSIWSHLSTVHFSSSLACRLPAWQSKRTSAKIPKNMPYDKIEREAWSPFTHEDYQDSREMRFNADFWIAPRAFDVITVLRNSRLVSHCWLMLSAQFPLCTSLSISRNSFCQLQGDWPCWWYCTQITVITMVTVVKLNFFGLLALIPSLSAG